MSDELVTMFGNEGVEKLKGLLKSGVDGSEQSLELEAVVGKAGVAKLRALLGGSGVVQPVDGGLNTLSSRPERDKVGGIVEPEVVNDEASVLSWSDIMDSDSPVSGVPSVSEDVRSRVVFGGFGGTVGVPSPGAVGVGGMSRYVRTSQAKLLRTQLSTLGIKLPKSAAWYTAMITNTAATMPSFFIGGKDKLRTLAVLGDAALTAAVASEALASGQSVESMQAVKTSMLTDGHLARVLVSSDFLQCFTFASGVDPRYTKTGATALEALFGIVAYYRSPADVLALAKHFGLV